ncbi:MAG TPA: plastocyanin/azurin family copper-binding protein [Gemmatimonadaceae bacterium]|jgi:plastocyanin|nr:plastocyanin/azurin family copper-binding protein [Gemmatimonadaceae bacterium]
MRFYGLAVAVGVVAISACAGGEKNPADTTHVAIDTSASSASTTTSTTATAGGTSSGTAAMAPITGTTHEVKMIGDAKGYRFDPANITVKQGDGIKFTVVSGGPHNVAFDAATIPADVKPQLDANMGTDKMGELSSNMKMNPGDAVTVSFANIKPGQYPFHCVPHLALGMKGVITVQ